MSDANLPVLAFSSPYMENGFGALQLYQGEKLLHTYERGGFDSDVPSYRNLRLKGDLNVEIQYAITVIRGGKEFILLLERAGPGRVEKELEVNPDVIK